MPIRITKYERYPSVGRDQLASAALNLCRALRARPKITSARYFWSDPGNTVAVIVEGQPGCFDYNPEPDPIAAKANYALMDLAHVQSNETWTDAGVGTRSWDVAGQPTGASR